MSSYHNVPIIGENRRRQELLDLATRKCQGRIQAQRIEELRQREPVRRSWADLPLAVQVESYMQDNDCVGFDSDGSMLPRWQVACRELAFLKSLNLVSVLAIGHKSGYANDLSPVFPDADDHKARIEEAWYGGLSDSPGGATVPAPRHESLLNRPQRRRNMVASLLERHSTCEAAKLAEAEGLPKASFFRIAKSLRAEHV